LSIDKLELNKISSNGTQSLILQIVRDNSPISRSGIVSKTGQPHAAVSRSTAAMIEKGILTEDGARDTAGPRKKRGLQLNADYGHVLSVEYGPDGFEGIVMNCAYQSIVQTSQQCDLTTAPQHEKIHQLKLFVEQLKIKSKTAKGVCLGIAVVDPGIVDDINGVSVMATTLDDWHNVPIAGIMEKDFKMPVKLLSTGNAKVRAVDRLELNNSIANFIYIEYGKGIACGMKLNGTYISGHGNLAGELGHLRITDTPTPCSCGGAGCLEVAASLRALVRIAKSSSPQTSSSLAHNSNITGMDVLKAAAQHDRLASRIVDEAFEKLGIAVAGLVNILSPKMVLFDNVIGQAGTDAVAVLLRTLQKSVLISHQQQLETKICSIESHLGALGGAAAILDDCITT